MPPDDDAASRSDSERNEFQRAHDFANQTMIDRRNEEVQRMIDRSIRKAFEDIDIDYSTFKGKKDFKEFIAFCARMISKELQIISTLDYTARRAPREDELNKAMDYVASQMASKKEDLALIRKSILTSIIGIIVAGLAGGLTAWLAVHK